MGALSNSGRRSANYVGYYKGIQSAGVAVMWAWDSTDAPYMAELASNWILLAGSLVVATPLFVWKIKDHGDEVEDLKDAGEIDGNTLSEADAEVGSVKR